MDKRTELIQFRLSQDELAAVREQATQSGQSVSEWARRELLAATTRTLIAATRSVPATEPTELPPPRYRCPDDCHVDAVVRRRTPGSCPACGKDCVELGPDRRQWARAAIAHLSVG
jgi:hypothetical protein